MCQEGVYLPAVVRLAFQIFVAPDIHSQRSELLPFRKRHNKNLRRYVGAARRLPVSQKQRLCRSLSQLEMKSSDVHTSQQPAWSLASTTLFGSRPRVSRRALPSTHSPYLTTRTYLSIGPGSDGWFGVGWFEIVIIVVVGVVVLGPKGFVDFARQAGSLIGNVAKATADATNKFFDGLEDEKLREIEQQALDEAAQSARKIGEKELREDESKTSSEEVAEAIKVKEAVTAPVSPSSVDINNTGNVKQNDQTRRSKEVNTSFATSESETINDESIQEVKHSTSSKETAAQQVKESEQIKNSEESKEVSEESDEEYEKQLKMIFERVDPPPLGEEEGDVTDLEIISNEDGVSSEMDALEQLEELERAYAEVKQRLLLESLEREYQEARRKIVEESSDGGAEASNNGK